MDPIMITEARELKRYIGHVKQPSGRLSGPYVDWFRDDTEARTGYRHILALQNYTVTSIVFDGQNVTIEVT
jgi:hypothetical protein